MSLANYPKQLVADALAMLGVRRLAIGIHDQSFPSSPDEDFGRGSPYSRAGRRFLEFVRELGFNAIQFGPQGKTTRGDPSPYNSAAFAKNVLSLSPLTLTEDAEELFESHAVQELAAIVDRSRERSAVHDRAHADHAAAWDAAQDLLDLANSHFRSGTTESVAGVRKAFAQFVASKQAAAIDWFTRDCLFEALSQRAGTDDWTRWGECKGMLPIDQRLFAPDAGEAADCRARIDELKHEESAAMERAAFGQFLVHRQHERLRRGAGELGLALLGDLQIGYSHQDCWSWRSLFLKGYLLGAPPSRTNPEGQPWGYPVLDPRLTRSLGASRSSSAGPALRFIWARAEKLFSEFDGLRIDHPQGWVCPWVYRSNTPDPFEAVRGGARLYSSPNFPDHPELSEFSIVEPEQLNPDPRCTRYDDAQVRDLRPEQIDRFAVPLDVILECAAAAGRQRSDVLCEVLSTWPMPLKAVMTARGLGRFCVTQKADAKNPLDVYRSENTAPSDWIMVGNHDTRPIWRIAGDQAGTPWMEDRCRLLAQRLLKDDGERAA
ncbi:MAG: 4-alpha-glucanotransferase, partial [Planctomycetota bacterium]